MRDDRQSPTTQGWVDDLATTSTRLDVADERTTVAFGRWLSTDVRLMENKATVSGLESLPCDLRGNPVSP